MPHHSNSYVDRSNAFVTCDRSPYGQANQAASVIRLNTIYPGRTELRSAAIAIVCNFVTTLVAGSAAVPSTLPLLA
jgi:hypothetical protein